MRPCIREPSARQDHHAGSADPAAPGRARPSRPARQHRPGTMAAIGRCEPSQMAARPVPGRHRMPHRRRPCTPTSSRFPTSACTSANSRGSNPRRWQSSTRPTVRRPSANASNAGSPSPPHGTPKPSPAPSAAGSRRRAPCASTFWSAASAAARRLRRGSARDYCAALAIRCRVPRSDRGSIAGCSSPMGRTSGISPSIGFAMWPPCCATRRVTDVPEAATHTCQWIRGSESWQ